MRRVVKTELRFVTSITLPVSRQLLTLSSDGEKKHTPPGSEHYLDNSPPLSLAHSALSICQYANRLLMSSVRGRRECPWLGCDAPDNAWMAQLIGGGVRPALWRAQPDQTLQPHPSTRLIVQPILPHRMRKSIAFLLAIFICQAVLRLSVVVLNFPIVWKRK